MSRIANRATDVISARAGQLSADDRRALRQLGGAALATHGLLHVMGITLIWRWNGPGNPRFSSWTPSPGSAPGIAVGCAWLVAGALFVAAAVFLTRGHHLWRPLAVAGAAVSIPALVPFADAALYGLFADSAVVVGLVLSRALHNSAARAVGVGCVTFHEGDRS